MNYSLTLLTLLFLISCGTKKNHIDYEVETIDEDRVIFTELNILEKIPYCGGARPTDDMLNRTKPVTAFFMLRGDNGFEKKVKSSEHGLINLTLEAGTYHLKEISKDVPFLTFYLSQKAIKNSINDPNIKIGSEDCYAKWWKKNVIDFKITDTTTVINETAYIFSNCYTSNPCDTYTGPIRP